MNIRLHLLCLLQADIQCRSANCIHAVSNLAWEDPKSIEMIRKEQRCCITSIDVVIHKQSSKLSCKVLVFLCDVHYLMFILCAGMQANSSEFLRRYGLSMLRSHIVLLTRIRDCQLEAPPKEPPVPRWKLIRQRKEMVVTDEPRSEWKTGERWKKRW